MRFVSCSCLPVVALLFTSAGITQAQSAPQSWVLQSSTLHYHVSHPLHDTDGYSHEARGKGTCAAGACDFLVGVPVKSFNSGDSNRDLHMIQVVKGAEFPLVTVRTRLPENACETHSFHADLEVSFAGQTAHYNQLPFTCVQQGSGVRITGRIPATLSDFKITPPSFLMAPLRNEMPIDVDLEWRRQ